MPNDLADSAMWVEAVTDHDAEENRRQVVGAKVALAGTWPYLAAASTPDDFEHRLALMREQIEAVTPAPVLAEVVASLREDFATMAAQHDAEADAEAQAARSVTAASYPGELPRAYVHVQDKGEYWQVDRIVDNSVTFLGRTAAHTDPTLAVNAAVAQQGLPVFINGAYVDTPGTLLPRVASDQEFLTADGKWVRLAERFRGSCDHCGGPVTEQLTPMGRSHVIHQPIAASQWQDAPGTWVSNGAYYVPGDEHQAHVAVASVQTDDAPGTGKKAPTGTTQRKSKEKTGTCFCGKTYLNIHNKICPQCGDHVPGYKGKQGEDESPANAKASVFNPDPTDAWRYNHYPPVPPSSGVGGQPPAPTPPNSQVGPDGFPPDLAVGEQSTPEAYARQLTPGQWVVPPNANWPADYLPNAATGLAPGQTPGNGNPAQAGVSRTAAEIDQHVTSYVDWARKNGHDPDEADTLKHYERQPGIGRAHTNRIADQLYIGGGESDWRRHSSLTYRGSEGVAPPFGTQAHEPNPYYFSNDSNGLASPPGSGFPEDPGPEPKTNNNIDDFYGAVPPVNSTGTSSDGSIDGQGYSRQAAAIPKGRQLCSNCDGQGTVGLSSSEGEHQCPQCNGKGHVKMGSHQRTAYSISQSLHSMESGDEQSFGAGKGGKKGGVHHVRYDAEQALGDDNQPAPGYTVGGYTVTSPGSAPAYYRHSPYKPNSSLGMAKMYAAEQAEKHIWHHERQHSASARTAEYHYVHKQGDKWVITQKGTGKVLSHHDSEEDAQASFRAMMQSKHSGARSPDFPRSARERTASSDSSDDFHGGDTGRNDYVKCPDCGANRARAGRKCPECGSDATRKMGAYIDTGEQSEHYRDPHYRPKVGPEGEDSDCNCTPDEFERQVNVNPMCPSHGHYAKEAMLDRLIAQQRQAAAGGSAPPAMADEEYREGQEHERRGLPPETAFGDLDDIYDAGYASRRHELGRMANQHFNDYYDGVDHGKAGFPLTHFESQPPSEYVEGHQVGQQARAEMSPEERADHDAYYHRVWTQNSPGYSTGQAHGSRMASTSGQIVGHCDHCRNPVRWHDGDGESGSGHLEHLHNSSHKCNVGASSTNTARTATLNGLTHLPQFFDLAAHTANGIDPGFATGGAGSVSGDMAGGATDLPNATPGAPPDATDMSGLGGSNMPQPVGRRIHPISSGFTTIQAANFTAPSPHSLQTNALQTITAPTPENPSGRSEDEYRANTWEGLINQRKMQSPEDRHVNTPVKPQDPIHTRNVNTPTPGLDDEREDSLRHEDDDDEDED